ncbi:cohesin domain-containing protein [Patescibacteria group bacterium]|nr:cohesin domain-containing protein [Patescibacteria group bacterium]
MVQIKYTEEDLEKAKEDENKPHPPKPPIYIDEPPENETPNEKFHRIFPIKTLLLIVVLGGIVAILIGISLYYKPSTPPALVTPVTPTLTDPVQTTLTVSSSPVSISTASAQYSTDIIINTGQDSVNTVQLELSYDPSAIGNVDIVPGPFFTNPQVLLKTIDQANGRVSFALGVQNGQPGSLGQGILAKFIFTSLKKNAKVFIQLLPKSQVTADGYSQSVLKSTVDASFYPNSIPVLNSPTPTPNY